MLSGIASYFFGSLEDEPLETTDVRLRVTPVDDEWALVDRSNCAFSCVTKNGECPCNSTDHLLLLASAEGANNSDMNSTDTNIDDNCKRKNGMEESWIVDPPSCFTGGRSASPAESPMENLLLEHPSMSVYNARGRPNSTGIESDPEDSSSSRVVRAPRRPRAVTARAGLLPKTQLVKSMQQVKRRASAKNLSRRNVDRHNKTYNLRSLDRQVRVQQPRKSYC